MKTVYTIVDRVGKKPVWIRIGDALENRDGSLNITLDVLPMNGRMHVRDLVPAETAETKENP